ncbi:MAG: DUF2795 domain-containing protein [Marinobacter sp.]|uniref:DUF2795 domain-containing protein n=1 Tax=Marinobacter sp. TaxID=50741 RepID=UPI00299F11E6|nr:DUF2795 domain-containing protein [Marinobacter sp.]MDX1635237.1 DUF2795 domain-containing protein [Marinobacter sp.]
MAMTKPHQRVDKVTSEAVAGLEFPASRDELVEQARAHGADPRIIDTLENIPERTYFSSEEVLKDIGEG